MSLRLKALAAGCLEKIKIKKTFKQFLQQARYKNFVPRSAL